MFANFVQPNNHYPNGYSSMQLITNEE